MGRPKKKDIPKPQTVDVVFHCVGHSEVYNDTYYQATFSEKFLPSNYFRAFDSDMTPLPIIKSSWMLKVKKKLDSKGFTTQVVAKALTDNKK